MIGQDNRDGMKRLIQQGIYKVLALLFSASKTGGVRRLYSSCFDVEINEKPTVQTLKIHFFKVKTECDWNVDSCRIQNGYVRSWEPNDTEYKICE